MAAYSLTCFGVGDGWPCADRKHSAFLYELGNPGETQRILIDAGEPISSSYKASGLDYDLIDRIFLSHFHFDHLGGFFMLLQGFWLENRKKDLHVHLPSHGIEPIRRLLEAGCIFDELLPFRLVFEPIVPGRPIAFGGMTVTAHPTTHLQGLRNSFREIHPNVYDAFSFLLESGTTRIGHTSDIGGVDDLEPLLQQRLDLLVCELAHVEPVDLFRRIQNADIQRAIFIHLSRRHWDELDKLQALATEVLQRIQFSFARDGEKIDAPSPVKRIAP